MSCTVCANSICTVKLCHRSLKSFPVQTYFSTFLVFLFSLYQNKLNLENV